MLAGIVFALPRLPGSSVAGADIYRVGPKGNVIAPLRSTEIAILALGNHVAR